MEHEVIYEYEKSIRSLFDYDIKQNKSTFKNKSKEGNVLELFHSVFLSTILN